MSLLEIDAILGNYQTTLEFSQLEIPTATDASLELLLPVLARPIVQNMVTGRSESVAFVERNGAFGTAFGLGELVRGTDGGYPTPRLLKYSVEQ